MVLLLGVVLVTDATAAYLQRSGLSTLADGAALYGADAGATGTSVYTEGVPEGDLPLDAGVAAAGVRAYLERVGAFREYPGLQITRVRVDPRTRSVLVELTAPLHLPLPMPGESDTALVTARGAGSTGVES
ncbi:hypothetical protein ISG29_11610 [Nocardioides sp. CBS4Y-1]|uniref:Putative Flp pilus-assembly TadG-like N-terminal domain-containing protein n=2 Tax=Nocardioides acrostichi TaxID=2784339 RepID=A0A930Y7S1_9ACTN|nr:hypothetical protein [Nocardioides acrostichi]